VFLLFAFAITMFAWMGWTMAGGFVGLPGLAFGALVAGGALVCMAGMGMHLPAVPGDRMAHVA
jgi:hypothetical protein